MTNLLYLEDAYLKAFSATVMDVVDGGVILDQTAFYAAGGGQPHDLGIITADEQIYTVTKGKKERQLNNQVVHYIAGELPVVGTAVHGKIDWERRYKLMRTHTAMHILCGTIFRDYGAQVTGGQMDPLKGRMDFEFETMRQELVAEIEVAINKEVAAKRDVVVNVLPRAEAFQIPDLIRTKINLLPEGITEIRTVEIVGLDLQADGGTHVQNTREVGRMRVTNYKSKGKINKRIYVELE